MSTVKNLTKELLVANRAGLHLRVAALISQTALRFGKDTEMTLRKGTYAADCRSVLDILAIGASPNETLTLEVSGTDSQEAMDALSGLFAAKFYEDGVSAGEHSE
ncbi:phosphocarrier protein HPr [Planctomycetales bacterium]|nr:phosphocarrier protein HPr [Planctomycetales bacterium]